MSRFGPSTAPRASRQEGPRRAVVKANYVRTTREGTRKVKWSAGYYLTRANELGEDQERSAFSMVDDQLSKEEVYRRIDLAVEEGEYHYRIVFAPDTDQNAEDVDMKAYAREMMNDLEVRTQQRIAWLAVEHVGDDAHSKHGHVHIVATTDQRLSRENLIDMRLEAEQAFAQALENRLENSAELDGGFGKKRELEQGLGLDLDAFDQGLGL